MVQTLLDVLRVSDSSSRGAAEGKPKRVARNSDIVRREINETQFANSLERYIDDARAGRRGEPEKVLPELQRRRGAAAEGAREVRPEAARDYFGYLAAFRDAQGARFVRSLGAALPKIAEYLALRSRS